MRKNFNILPSPINGEGLSAAKDFALHEIVLRWEDSVKFALYLNHSCNPRAYTQEVENDTWQRDILKAGEGGELRQEKK